MSTPYIERDEQRTGGDECDVHTVVAAVAVAMAVVAVEAPRTLK